MIPTDAEIVKAHQARKGKLELMRLIYHLQFADNIDDQTRLYCEIEELLNHYNLEPRGIVL